ECDVPVPPITLGYILGPMIEKNFRTAMYTARGNIMAITGRPVALAIVTFSVLLIIWPYISDYLKSRKITTA
ncbi:MAG: tripartite tricarboxylate transporter permease, partial [Atribacterota bacterium]|nr:tripartite tricarboxylate transporter permease [Atribacterota bacterium]